MSRATTGTVVRIGDKWRARCNHVHLGMFETEQEAWDVINAYRILEGKAGRKPDILREFGGEWLNERELGGHVRGIKRERSVWRSRVETAPFIDWPLKSIKPKHVKAWVHDLFKQEAMHASRTTGKPTITGTGRRLSRQSVVHAHRLLSLCLDDAVLAGKLTTENPARFVRMPKQDEIEEGELIVYATVEEIAALFALDLSLRERAVFAVAIYAGLRAGELWGLRWEDVGDKFLKVRRSYNGPLKSKTSRRDVPLFPVVRDALKAYRASLNPRPIAGLIWPKDGGGCHHSGYTAGWYGKRERRGGDVVRVSKGWRELAGIRDCVRFQDLRHTCGCHLVQGTWTARPVSMLKVKTWLGHSSISVTERHYARLAPGNLLEELEGVEEAAERKDTER